MTLFDDYHCYSDFFSTYLSDYYDYPIIMLIVIFMMIIMLTMIIVTILMIIIYHYLHIIILFGQIWK